MRWLACSVYFAVGTWSLYIDPGDYALESSGGAGASARPHLPAREELAENALPSSHVRIVGRDRWSSRRPKDTVAIPSPVPYVVIHHSYRPTACYSEKRCFEAMRAMQAYHMDQRGWWDIGYNFAVGSDGVVYEGRGWDTLGAHSLFFNSISLGICLIGDWTDKMPPPEQLIAAKDLIDEGVDKGYIRSDYKLVGHRQVRDTECPGETLYQEITGWPHHRPHPNSVKDLLEVDELADEVKVKVRAYLRINGTGNGTRKELL